VGVCSPSSFWEDEGPAQLDGDPIVAEAGWSWAPVDQPSPRRLLHEAPLFEPGMEHEDLVRVHEGARDAAQREILDYLGRG
jgi:hypothetical protein